MASYLPTNNTAVAVKLTWGVNTRNRDNDVRSGNWIGVENALAYKMRLAYSGCTPSSCSKTKAIRTTRGAPAVIARSTPVASSQQRCLVSTRGARSHTCGQSRHTTPRPGTSRRFGSSRCSDAGVTLSVARYFWHATATEPVHENFHPDVFRSTIYKENHRRASARPSSMPAEIAASIESKSAEM